MKFIRATRDTHVHKTSVGLKQMQQKNPRLKTKKQGYTVAILTPGPKHGTNNTVTHSVAFIAE
jgi:hypothetical protein